MNELYSNCTNVHPHKIVVYRKWNGPRSMRIKHVNSLANLRHNDHKGKISSQAASKITSYINIILAQAKRKRFWHETDQCYYWFRVNFITLTLQAKQEHTDQQIKRELLGQWLQELRQKHPGVKYFWRAEKQKNGNIHFHVLTDVFYHYRELRSDWNRICSKLGYVNRFAAKHGHMDANSTDVHAIKGIRNLGAYLAKYCTKQNKEHAITGRNYGACEAVVKYAKLALDEGDFDMDELNHIRPIIYIKKSSNEYFTCVFGNIHKWLLKVENKLSELYFTNLLTLQNTS